MARVLEGFHRFSCTLARSSAIGETHRSRQTQPRSGVDFFVKYGGIRVSQVKPSDCFMRIEKLVSPSIYDTSLSSLMMWNLQSYPTTVLNERIEIFRWFKTYSDPSYIFSWGQGPWLSGICTPWTQLESCCRSLYITAGHARAHVIDKWNRGWSTKARLCPCAWCIEF